MASTLWLLALFQSISDVKFSRSHRVLGIANVPRPLENPQEQLYNHNKSGKEMNSLLPGTLFVERGQS